MLVAVIRDVCKDHTTRVSVDSAGRLGLLPDRRNKEYQSSRRADEVPRCRHGMGKKAERPGEVRKLR